MFFYYGFLNEQLQLFATGWFIMELINWMIYLFMYMKIIDPVLLCLNKQDINKIINRIDKLNKNEIEHIIKGSIMYDKQTHENINPTEFDIKNLSKNEIIFLKMKLFFKKGNYFSKMKLFSIDSFFELTVA
jgi:hypothetical protein